MDAHKRLFSGGVIVAALAVGAWAIPTGAAITPTDTPAPIGNGTMTDHMGTMGDMTTMTDHMGTMGDMTTMTDHMGTMGDACEVTGSRDRSSPTP